MRSSSASGSALFALGFRPFYLLAGLYAAAAVPIWVAQYSGLLSRPNPLWHAHEMLFGYAFAVIAGFLLTAVRNWTGRPTPSGARLAAIAALWIAARLVAPFSLFGASLLDLVFAAALAWGIGEPIVASKNRNWHFVVLVLAIGAASVLFRFAPLLALNAGLDLVLLVLSVIAGRVVPLFTNNAVPGARARRLPSVEYLALGSIVALLALDLAELDLAAGIVAFVGAGAHAFRLALWQPLKTRRTPILWILHLSYAWVVVHLALRGLAAFDIAPAVLATHALTVGAIGGMTIGMMTRTSRGHTGMPLTTGAAELAAYLLVQAAAVTRVLVPLALPSAYGPCVASSAVFWSAAFAVFFVRYLPLLTRARLDGKPG